MFARYHVHKMSKNEPIHELIALMSQIFLSTSQNGTEIIFSQEMEKTIVLFNVNANYI